MVAAENSDFDFFRGGAKPSPHDEFSSWGNFFGLIFGFMIFYFGFQGYVQLQD